MTCQRITKTVHNSTTIVRQCCFSDFIDCRICCFFSFRDLTYFTLQIQVIVIEMVILDSIVVFNTIAQFINSELLVSVISSLSDRRSYSSEDDRILNTQILVIEHTLVIISTYISTVDKAVDCFTSSSSSHIIQLTFKYLISIFTVVNLHTTCYA